MTEREAREQALVAEIPWLRQLARELAGDAHGSDDLVQEACRIALCRPPRRIERGSLRAWLRSVIQSASWLGHRERMRAEQRERASARPESIEGVDEVVARAELQRRLLALVLGVREPLRSVLVLRYYRGLDTAEIAARLRCSEDNVRQRQARGLAELREGTRHDRELRDLLSITGCMPRHTERALRWSAAACLAVVAACLAPRLDGGPESNSERPAILVDPNDPSAVAESSTAKAVEPVFSREVQAPAAVQPWLAVRVRDARTLEPLEGAQIARARTKGWQELADDVDATFVRLGIADSAGRYLALSREESMPPEPGTENQPPFAPREESVLATTDGAGRATLGTRLPPDEQLVVRCAGRGARTISAADVAKLDGAELVVDLHPAGKLRVRVRTLEGLAVEDAFLRVEAVPFLPQFRPQPAIPLVDGLAWHGPTDEKGEFEIEDLPLDDALIVTPLSRYIGKPADVLLTAGAPAQSLELIVVAPGGISGRLVDHAGKPLAGARVDCMPRRPWYSRAVNGTTDEDGCFRLSGVPSGTQDLNCVPDYSGGYAEMNDRPLEVIVEPFSQTDVGLLVFGESTVCSGRVSGLPRELEHEFNRTRLELVQGERTFHFGVQQDGSFRVLAQPGPAKLQLILATEWDGGRPIQSKTVVLPCSDVELEVASKLATLRFRVNHGPGADQVVSAQLYDHALDDPDGLPAWEGALARYEFDVEGEDLLLKTLAPGKYRLELQVAGGAHSWVGDVHLEAGKTCDIGTLVPGTADLSGALVDAPPNSTVHIVRRVDGAFGKGAFGEQRFDKRSTAVDANGTFRFDDVPAGLWCATSTSEGAELVEGALVDLRVGDSKAITLRASKAGHLRCRVHKGGVPVIGAIASYSFARSASLRPFFELNPGPALLPSDRNGWIDMGTFFPGPYRINIEADGEMIQRELAIAWGEQRELEFDLGASEFELTIAAPPDWIERLSYLEYRSLENNSSRGLRVRGKRVDKNSFRLRAPASKGYVVLSFVRASRGATVAVPLELREDHRDVRLAVPTGEIVLRVGSASDVWALPAVCVTEFSTGKIQDADAWLSSVPLEALPDGRWLARGIPDGATVRIQAGDQRLRFGPPAKLVHFESGRLELDWP